MPSTILPDPLGRILHVVDAFLRPAVNEVDQCTEKVNDPLLSEVAGLARQAVDLLAVAAEEHAARDSR